VQFTRTLLIAAPREKVWDLVADTDRLNREMHLMPVEYAFVPRPMGGTNMFGTIQVGKLRLRYRENPWEWMRPEFHVVQRIFERGPILEIRMRVHLAEEAGGTRVVCETCVTPRYRTAAPLLRLVGRKILADMSATWQSFAAFLTGQIPTPYPKHRGLAPIWSDRLERRVAALDRTEADPAIVRLLAQHLTDSPPEDVTLLRPFVLADAWGMDRLAVLRTLLLATSAELLELRWRLLCPSCRGSAPENTDRHLENLQAQVHCPSCNIRFDAAFDQSVEVCFAVSPQIRPVQEATYCRGGPGLTPHVYAQFPLEPGETRELTLALPPGRYALVSPQALESINLLLGPEQREEGKEGKREEGRGKSSDSPSPAECRRMRTRAVERPNHAVEGSRGEGVRGRGAAERSEVIQEESGSSSLFPLPSSLVVLEAHAGRATLAVSCMQVLPLAQWTLSNRTEELAVFRFEAQEFGLPVATAALVTSLQTFRDQFSSEVLKPGAEMAVRQICVLFSDLKGSTALYRERGDAPSYRTVRDHFDALKRIIAGCGGAVVKTIGDAVMATFTDPVHGLAAALTIQEAARDWPDHLTIKLGLHAGPAIAVNANDLLDYFGQTVNLASRLVGESQGGDVVVAAELLQDAQIAALLAEKGCHTEPFTHVVRGFEVPLPMVRITVGDPRESRTAL
jgi:adenylate cyclase